MNNTNEEFKGEAFEELPDAELDTKIDGNSDGTPKEKIQDSKEEKDKVTCLKVKADAKDISADDVIKGVEKGIYIVGRGSYSIDQQRYNFQFGGQLFYRIENGKIVEQIEDVAYQSNTQEFWNSCSALAGKSDYRLGGSFFDGKGQPVQVSAVSHGCPTTRFDNVSVINTKRKV